MRVCGAHVKQVRSASQFTGRMPASHLATDICYLAVKMWSKEGLPFFFFPQDQISSPECLGDRLDKKVENKTTYSRVCYILSATIKNE